MLWVAWLVITADQKITDDETLLMRHPMRLVRDRHQVFAEADHDDHLVEPVLLGRIGVREWARSLNHPTGTRRPLRRGRDRSAGCRRPPAPRAGRRRRPRPARHRPGREARAAIDAEAARLTAFFGASASAPVSAPHWNGGCRPKGVRAGIRTLAAEQRGPGCAGQGVTTKRVRASPGGTRDCGRPRRRRPRKLWSGCRWSPRPAADRRRSR